MSTSQVINPATEEVLETVPRGTRADALAAVSAAAVVPACSSAAE